MLRFYFLHIGSVNEITQMFVESIRISNPDSQIIQVSDMESTKLSTVDECIRYNGDVSNLMKFRTEAFSKIEIGDSSSNIFLDSDMLIVKKININLLFDNFSAVFCQRFYDTDQPVNFNFMNLKMFEYINKNLGEVWPILGCFVALRKRNIFKSINDLYDGLDKKYYKWFGDQISMRLFYEKERKNIKLVTEKLYANTYPERTDSDPYIIHFKGSKKKGMKDYFNNFLKS